MADSAPDVFKNTSEVHEYISANGHKIAKATVYNHVKWGWLRPDKGKGFSFAAVKKYIKERLDPDGAQADEFQLAGKKDADARKAAAQAKHWEIKTNILEGKYIERELFERELAGRAMVLRSDMENFFRSRAPEIIAFVDGDGNRSPDLIEYLLDHLEKWFGRYSEEKEFPVNTPPE